MKYFLGLMFMFSISISNASASESVGSILPSFKLSKVCQDVTCTNFGIVNFAPTLNAMTPGATAVTITDTSITGHAWGNQIGWINLAPTGLTAGQTLKVNPNTGVITGLGFANTGSWINFYPTGGGVIINASGEFVGWAWVTGAYGGWMKFDCSIASTCVKTDWRPIPNRTTTSGGSSSTSGCTTNCTQIVTPTPTPTTPLNPTTPTTPNTPTNNPTTPGNNNTGNTNSGNGIKPNNPGQPRNTFDPSGTGEPNKPPETIVDTTKYIPAGTISEVVNDPTREGEYKEAFPKKQTEFTQNRRCSFCIVIRRDFTPTQEITTGPDGKITAGGMVIKERRIIKYGFVSKKYEVRFPLSKIGANIGVQTDPRAELDLTSVGLTLGLLVILRKLIVIMLIK